MDHFTVAREAMIAEMPKTFGEREALLAESVFTLSAAVMAEAVETGHTLEEAQAKGLTFVKALQGFLGEYLTLS